MERGHCVLSYQGSYWFSEYCQVSVQPKYQFQSLDTGRIPPIELPVGSEEFHVRKAAPRPSKEDAVKKHQSRLVMM